MSVIQNINKKQKLIWSSLRSRLNISLHEQNLINLIKFPEIQERLEKFLSYYTQGNKNEDLPNDLKFLNRLSITPLMRSFISTISDCLNMTKKNCFDLMDNYFFLHPEELDKLSQLLSHFVSYSDKSSRRYENIKTDLEDKRAKIIEFYFKERKNLILFYSDIFYKIYLEIENTPLDLLRLMKAFIQSKNLLQVFSKQLVSYDIDPNNNEIFDRNKFNNHYVKEIMYKIPVYLSEEQNLILELIMILLDKGKYSDSNAFEILFNYFLKTNFYGYSQILNADNNRLKNEIRIKSIAIILNTFQPEIVNKVIEGETNLLNNLICIKNYFNILLKVYEQPINIYILYPIKLAISCIIELIKNNRNAINNSNELINKYEHIPNQNKIISDRDCFGIINSNDQDIQMFEGEINIEKGLTIYDVYYDILYEWINMIMGLYYKEDIGRYEIQMIELLLRVLSHYLPQRKFYYNILNKKKNNIVDYFDVLKLEDEKRSIFLRLCFSLSKSIEPGEGNDNNEYLLNILFTEPMEELKNRLKDENNFDKKQEIIEDLEKDVFFYDILEEWNNLIQELFQYSQQYQNPDQLNMDMQEALPEDLSILINYIRLFIRSVLPKNCFSNFIFNYTWYYNLKKINNINDNIEEDLDENINIQAYNPEILKQLIFKSVTVLSLITELQIQNRNILFGEFITELLKLFIIYAKDSHFTECLKNMNFFFEKFNGKNIIYNIIVNDNNTQDFSNSLYAVKFLKQMFKPDIFLVVSRNSEFNTPNKFGESFYMSNFYYLKELINHFTQVNEFLTPLNALLIAELGEVMTLIMNYLEFKNNLHKIDIIETQNIYYENKNLANFVMQLLMQDTKEYFIEDNGKRNIINSVLLIEFIFKFIGIKLNDRSKHNLELNEIQKKIYYNNTYVQLYLNQNNLSKENFNVNNSYNMNCYKKMILSIMNCLNKILSLLIILQKNESKKDKNSEKNNQNIKYKLNNISFVNKLYNTFIQNKEIPHYIYESIDDKRKYNFNIILLLLFYSSYEIDKNEQLIIKRKHVIDLGEENTSDLEFFMVDLKDDAQLNISTTALNNINKIIYILRDSGININNYLNLEEISSSELYTNVKLFKYIRYNLVNILGNPNTNVDLLKLEILKFLTLSSKYQLTFLKDFIQGDDEIHHNTIIFNHLNRALKINYNFNENEINNNQVDYDLKIESKSLKSELFTYTIIFISELLNETQDIKIIESLLIKDNGIILMNNLIHYGIHSCDIGKNYDIFYSYFSKYINNSKNNISDIMFISNQFKLVIDVLSLKLNIIKALSLIFKRILLFSKNTKNIKINFKYSNELKFFFHTHISNIIEFYSKSNQYDYIQVFKDMKKDFEENGLQLRQKYLNADNNMNKENLEMIIGNYLYRYDYNYSFDLKEFIVKGFYDKMFKDKYLKNIVINNSFICYNYLIVQSLAQCAHLYGLILSIGDYNYLLSNKLFSDSEVYKIFNESIGKNELIDMYTEEINSILNYDNCYNYKLTFNPLEDFFKNNENDIIRFIKNIIIEKCLNVQVIPKLTLDEHRLYYQMLNCSFDYIIYLHNRTARSKNQINVTIDLFDFLKKVTAILNDGVINKTISDSNLLSVLNLIDHIIYYLVLTEKSFDYSEKNNNKENIMDMNNLINNNIDEDDDKIQIITELMGVLIMIFKTIKESRSILLYIFSTIVYIENEALKNPIMELFNIIIKLYTKENDSFEFHSFLLLLYRLRINYPTLLLDNLKDSQIFNFISLKCGYNLEYKLYENQVHTSGHLIYCWTLKIFNSILDTYLTKIGTELKPNYNIVISYCMRFIELIQQRLKTLFNICINENFISGINQNNYISMAYLDELNASIEFINSFISIECDNSCPNTKDPSFLEFLFDSVDLIANTCLFLFKNKYQQIFDLCRPNSKLEIFMQNTKVTESDFNNNNNFNINNISNIKNLNYFQNSLENDNNLYKNLINNNNNPRNNINSLNEDKTANVFHFKLKINLIKIIFHISSSMIQLLNRQNFNIKQYFFNKYQLKENENQLNTWPMLYLNSIKFSADFLEDIMLNLKKYKLLYNKSVILMNSLNISFSNCFIGEIEPEYPLNELIDMILFILSDFCSLTPNFNEFIELIVKNHPYINNNRAVFRNIDKLTGKIENHIQRYSGEFEEEDNFIDDFKDLKNIIAETKSNKFKI